MLYREWMPTQCPVSMTSLTYWEKLATSQHFLAKGYWQVPLSPGTGEKTAFSSTLGLFEFTVMPFGLQGAPATFQRLMDSVVAGLSFCAAYLDDVVIFSETWTEHISHLEQVFVSLGKAGLTVKASKCQIGMREWEWLC